MAYLVLARKWRPQRFDDIVGQGHVTQVLRNAIGAGRIAHAYLFTGVRGVGKTTAARVLAKALNCEKGPTANPCNECSQCVEITDGRSIDVYEIDGASNRGIADVQALREKVRFSPTGGRYRVVIIDEVHQLSNDAFAALLKTLEEPPAHLVFVFATTDPQKLPDTIRSRTQRFDFARVPLRKVADRLLDIGVREAKDAEGLRFTLAEDAALLIAHKSEGSMRDAVSALDQVISAGESEITSELVRRVLGLADREVFFSLGGAILAHDARATLEALHRAFEKGLDARELAEGLAEHMRHLLMLSIDPEDSDLVPASREDLARLREQAAGWSEADLLRLLRIASDVQWPLRESPQPLIHLEAAVIQMAALERGETVADLIERLEALEARLGGSPLPASSAARSAGAPGAAASRPTPGASASRPAPGSARSAPPPAGGRAPGAPPAGGRAPGDPGRSGGSGGGAPTARSSDQAPTAARDPRGATIMAGAGATTAAISDGAHLTAIATATEAEPGDEANWLRAIEAVGKRKAMLGAFLEACRFVGLSDGRVSLAMDDLHRSVIGGDKENRAIAIEELTRAFGRAVELDCLPLDGEAAPLRPAADDVKPMIEEAIRWFEGDIIERAGGAAERTER